MGGTRSRWGGSWWSTSSKEPTIRLSPRRLVPGVDPGDFPGLLSLSLTSLSSSLLC
ncbi:hypothetical protein [Corynebacterium phocae]|uniref:hypothetical protein n=1 Tax=Corynebacterium phocae TaxID=161895 RepID=UPI003CCC2A84